MCLVEDLFSLTVAMDIRLVSNIVQLYVCPGVSFPLVSAVRFLLQDCWTVMSKDYMALIDPPRNPAPIVRQGVFS